MTTTISLIRHGLVHNPDDLYYGHLPGFRLARKGRTQATAAGRYLAQFDVTAIYHSPMQRARETAELVAAELAAPVPLIVCDLINEIYSPFDGLPIAEMKRRNWDLYTGVEPPYEQPRDILARMKQFFAQVRAEHPGQHVVGVSHGDPVAFAILDAFGYPLLPSDKQLLVECGVDDLYPAPASISTFLFANDGAFVEYRYHCPHDNS